MRARILKPEEWGRLKEGELPALLPLMEPKNVAVAVVEDDNGEVVACLSALQATFLEGLWIAPKWRGNAGVCRSLIRLAAAVPRVRGEHWAFCSVDKAGHVKDYVKRLGGNEMTGSFCVLPIRAGG